MKDKTIKILFGVTGGLIFILTLFSVFGVFDEGEYDYCIEWEGIGGTLKRSNLLHTCFNLATQTFYCDYDINKETQILMVKGITNITKDKDGMITEIIYDEPNYFNCTRWLKSK